MKWLIAVIVVLALAMGVGYFVVQNQSAPAAQEAPDPDKPQMLLMIPGYGGSKGELQTLSRDLQKDGIRSEIVDIGNGEGDLAEYAGDVIKKADDWIAQGYVVNLLGYSAGGVTARAADQQAPGKFHKIVTLGSPHNGTSIADLGSLFGQCPTACQQLRPDSDLLTGLPTADDNLLSVYSTTDEVIVPSSSSDLAGAQVVTIQELCADEPVGHGSVPNNPASVALLTAFLLDAPLPTTCPA